MCVPWDDFVTMATYFLHGPGRHGYYLRPTSEVPQIPGLYRKVRTHGSGVKSAGPCVKDKK